MSGKVLSSEPFATGDTDIDMEAYPAGTYQLNVVAGSTDLKTFQIIKN